MSEEHTQAWHYCRLYIKTFNQFNGADGGAQLPESARHDRARRVVHHAKLTLTAAELRQCERWLDEKYPARTQKLVVQREPGLFDDEIMRVD